MIVNQNPYRIDFDMKLSQTLTCRYGEIGRQYQFYTDIDLTGLSANLQVIKPDGTFVIEAASVVITEEEQYIVVEIPLQATVVKGVCRYDINIYNDDLLLYTAEGPLWVDDQLITEDMIESIAEVYGLRFPQDFLTVENLVDIVNYVKAEIIKDDVIAEDTTWSSQKIEQEISSATPDIDVSKEVTGNPIEFSDGADAPLLQCVTHITGYQEGTGTPSPDNIRPIVAYSTGTIEVEDGDGNTTTHTTTYPKAIYRGSEDVVNGEVTSEWGVFSISDYVWSGSNGAFYTVQVANLIKHGDGRYDHCICECYATENVPSTNQLSDGAMSVDNNGYIQIKDTRYALSSDFMAAMGSYKIVYELATPTTSSVTPTNLPVKSLSGYNHIESSTGEMTLEYLTQTYDPIADLIDRSALHVYSTEEKIVGKWIDGKDLYEKTFTEQLSGNLAQIDISDLDIDFGWIESGCYDIGGSYLGLNEYLGGSCTQTHLSPVSPYEFIYCYNSHTSDSTVYVTIRYTKL